MASIDESTEQTLIFALTNIVVKHLCDLLIEKGVITEEEYKKIVDDANNSLQKAFMEK